MAEKHCMFISAGDNPVTRLLDFYLNNQGIAIITVMNEHQAIEHLSYNNVDIIIINDLLPDFDAISIATRIREISSIPVLLLLTTVHRDNGIKVETIDVGYIVKPFERDVLLVHIQKLLHRNKRTD